MNHQKLFAAICASSLKHQLHGGTSFREAQVVAQPTTVIPAHKPLIPETHEQIAGHHTCDWGVQGW